MSARHVRVVVPFLVAGLVASCGSASPTASSAASQPVSGPSSATVTAEPEATTRTLATASPDYSGTATNNGLGPIPQQTDCHARTYMVGPNTSCPFGAAVARVAFEAHKATGQWPATVRAYSPVTRQTYTLRCTLNAAEELGCATGTAEITVLISPIPVSSSAS